MIDWVSYGVLAGLVLAGAVLRGLAGIGLALVTVPVASVIFGPRQAVFLLSLPLCLVNVLAAWHTGFLESPLRRFTGLFLAFLVGGFFGANLLVTLPLSVLSVAIGTLTLVGVGLQLRAARPRLSAQAERLANPLAGLGIGSLSGSSGVAGPLLALYLQGLELPRRHYLAIFSAALTCSTAMQLLVLFQQETYRANALLPSTFLLLPMAVGFYLGDFIQARLTDNAFKRALLILLAVTGAQLVLKGTLGL